VFIELNKSYKEKVHENGKIGNELILQKKLIDSIHDQSHGLIYEGPLNVSELQSK